MYTVPQTQTVAQFDTQLRALAERAHTKYPDEIRRVDKGLLLALNGHVTLHADGTASVQSERDPEVVYQVGHGRCDCPDFSRAPLFCKHKLAVCLTKKAHKALAPTYTRTAYWGWLGEEHGQFLREEGGAVVFLSDDDRREVVTEADYPRIQLNGDVALAADQRRRDADAQTDLARIEAARMAA